MATPRASSARTISATGMSILPTVHGFDEYAGVLYHLNALEEPENVYYPKDPGFLQRTSDRGIRNPHLGDRHSSTRH